MTSTTRQLGTWEYAHAQLHSQQQGHGLIAGAIRIASKLCPVRLKHALQQLHQCHALLQCCLKATIDNDYKFVANVPFARIPYTFIRNDNNTFWLQSLQQALNRKLPSEEYLWRIDIIQSNGKANYTDLIISIHHAICDGVSLLRFSQQLMVHYQQTHHETIKTNLPLAVEDIIKTPSQTDEQAIEWQNDILQNEMHYSQLRQSQIITKQLSQQQTQQLKTIAKQNQVSLNALLNAQMLRSAFKLEPEKTYIQLNTPICMRPYISENHRQQFACYTSMISTQHSRKILAQSNDTIPLAQDYRQQVKLALSKRDFIPQKNQQHTLRRLIDQLCQASPLQCQLGYCVSFLGNHHKQQQSVYPVEFIYGGPARMISDFKILLCVVEMNQQLYFSFHYCSPLIHGDWVRGFVDDYLTALPY